MSQLDIVLFDSSVNYNNAITLVLCYFGNLPKWFDFFLETCKYNSSVEFIIFTDGEQQYVYPKNVTYKKLSLAEFNYLASTKLGLEICLSEPYKVCDFKPAYGVIFEDYLRDADFWGHCDLDIIFGNIRSFITNEILNEFDVVTARKEYLVGHFTLYKNNDTINRLYEQSKDCQFVFQSQDLFSFDECNFLWWYLLNGYNILNLQSTIESMSHVVRKLDQSGVINVYFDTIMLEQKIVDIYGNIEAFNGEVFWREGELTDAATGQNLLYFHFHFLKKRSDFYIPHWQKIPGEFKISDKGFTKPYE